MVSPNKKNFEGKLNFVGRKQDLEEIPAFSDSSSSLGRDTFFDTDSSDSKEETSEDFEKELEDLGFDEDDQDNMLADFRQKIDKNL